MGKLKVISLKTSLKIIEDVKKATRYFSGKNKKYLAYRYVMKSYPAYDKSFFYEKFKLYLLFKKETKNLIKEDWIKESKEHKKRLKELKKIEEDRFFITCAGDDTVYENTYGYTYQF